jgi:hypothetical protein
MRDTSGARTISQCRERIHSDGPTRGEVWWRLSFTRSAWPGPSPDASIALADASWASRSQPASRTRRAAARTVHEESDGHADGDDEVGEPSCTRIRPRRYDRHCRRHEPERPQRPPPVWPEDQRHRCRHEQQPGGQPEHAKQRRDGLRELRQVGKPERFREAEKVNQAMCGDEQGKDDSDHVDTGTACSTVPGDSDSFTA